MGMGEQRVDTIVILQAMQLLPLSLSCGQNEVMKTKFRIFSIKDWFPFQYLSDNKVGCCFIFSIFCESQY